MSLKIRDKKKNKLIVTINDEGDIVLPTPIEKEEVNDDVLRLGSPAGTSTNPTTADGK